MLCKRDVQYCHMRCYARSSGFLIYWLVNAFSLIMNHPVVLCECWTRWLVAVYQTLLCLGYVRLNKENCAHTRYSKTLPIRYINLGVLPPRLLVHLNVVSARSLLGPPWGASTNPRSSPRYSVNATVTSSTPLLALDITSSRCVRLTRSCLGRQHNILSTNAISFFMKWYSSVGDN